MPVSPDEIASLWARFADAMNMESPPPPNDDGHYRVRFRDGAEIEMGVSRGEAVFSAHVADLPSDPGERHGLAKHFLLVSLAKAGEWEESVYAEARAVRLWRRFRDAGDPGFNLDGIEQFLNRLDFWKRQSGVVEARNRRQAPSAGGFISLDQFG